MGDHKRNVIAIRHNKDESSSLDCYRILISGGLLHNAQSGRPTYVDVFEGLHLPAKAFGQVMPIQVHCAIAAVGTYVVKLSWVSAEDGSTHPVGDTGDTTLEIKCDGRFHLTVPAIRMPKSPGIYLLTLQWKYPTDLVWQNGAARCPIDVALLKPAGAPAEAVAPS